MATPIPSNRARFSLSEVALATGGRVAREGASVDEAVGIYTDSRAVVQGSAFVALRGEAHDGHAFVDTAIARGASIVVVERGRGAAVRAGDASVVEVDDTLVAWGALARAHLTRWRKEQPAGRVVAITGSAGKTTTKELTAALLAEIAPTHATAGNLNNRIGVPAVVFALEAAHRFCVLEMGMSLPGELDAITDIARPDVSVIVNVGVAHAEGVGGREGVKREKGAVYRALAADGVAVVNADDDFVTAAAREAGVARVATFGRGRADARRASDDPGVVVDERAAVDETAPPRYRLVARNPEGGGSRVALSCAGRDLSVYLPLPGEAAAIDLLAALAAQEAASLEALSADRIERALGGVRLGGRGTLRKLAGDLVVLDDTYNANPASMRSALATLAEIAGPRRKVAVLGEMKELGPLADDEHVALGDAIADAGVALAIGCGGLVRLSLDRAASRGVRVVHAASTAEAAVHATTSVEDGDAVLVKGSRSTGTEAVVTALEQRPR